MVRDGMVSQALGELEKIVEEHPSSPLADDALWRAARLREASGRNDEAAADYLKVVSLYPKSDRAPESAYLLAMLYLHRIKDREKAVPALKRVAEQYPDSPYSPRALFQLALAQKEPDTNFIEKLFSSSSKTSDQAAAQTLEKIVRDYPRSEEAPGALIELAKVYGPERLNQPRKSLEVLGTLRQRYPKTTFPIDYYLAVNYEALGEKKTARELYKKFLAARPTGPEAREAQKRLENL
jgi:TolA-binding protein